MIKITTDATIKTIDMGDTMVAEEIAIEDINQHPTINHVALSAIVKNI